jgi:acyl-CoA oxidase
MAHIERELKTATFPVKELQWFLYGTKEQHELTKKLEGMFDQDPLFQNVLEEHFLPREEQVKRAVKRGMRSIELMKKCPEYLALHSPVHGDADGTYAPAARVSANHCGITDHFALFCNTVMAQSTPEQLKEWLMRAVKLEIIGTYAQTELGHGSNVRGLETIATFEKETDTILINMPSITAMKWWPGALGLIATHAVIYARLLVDGKDHGFNAFMVQIRDENHKPLPGVEVGDLGPKIGDNHMDAGYLYLKNVRIPRTNMLAKFQQLSRDGTFTKINPNLAKIAYVTMMRARVHLVRGAGGRLAAALCIALRYNAFRKQGFIDSKKGIEGGERVILDYTVQQARMFPQLAASFTILFAANSLLDQMKSFDKAVKAAGKDLSKLDASMIPELHAASSGLKAFTTEIALNGMEEARRCCGGHGYALYSGIAAMVMDYMPSVTYEGDRHPMALQCARAIMGALSGKVKKTAQFKHLGPLVGSTSFKNPKDLNHLVKVWESVANRAALDAGKALMAANKKFKASDKAWNACHIQLIRAAWAHVMLYLVREGANTIANRAPASLKPVFSVLVRLFALSKLAEAPAAIAQLSASQAKLLDQSIAELVSEVRPNAIALVEGFDLCDRFLHSAIGVKADDIYERIYKFAQACPLNRPEYVESVRKETLSQTLNQKYLAAGNKSRL